MRIPTHSRSTRLDYTAMITRIRVDLLDEREHGHQLVRTRNSPSRRTKNAITARPLTGLGLGGKVGSNGAKSSNEFMDPWELSSRSSERRADSQTQAPFRSPPVSGLMRESEPPMSQLSASRPILDELGWAGMMFGRHAGWHSDWPSYSEYRNVLETVWKPLGGPIEASTSSTSRPFPVDWAEGFGGLGPIVHVSFSFSPSGTR
ncbi:hypothetical protein ASPTUDRAFT_29851 [Aspergillus tubingensis CBS 134.48]|uniref:Uncharacterized protein n=1 Tax=Aspergillus tubingensis (strain CBS 134.48) TaxID=767770 RepID=A0A1L9N3F5_ASPTC|nr:hypothetical protein ASPTUDRAFT_29851 [Aspergillus tubingensis CBS 134.48]